MVCSAALVHSPSCGAMARWERAILRRVSSHLAINSSSAPVPRTDASMPRCYRSAPAHAMRVAARIHRSRVMRLLGPSCILRPLAIASHPDPPASAGAGLDRLNCGRRIETRFRSEDANSLTWYTAQLSSTVHRAGGWLGGSGQSSGEQSSLMPSIDQHVSTVSTPRWPHCSTLQE